MALRARPAAEPLIGWNNRSRVAKRNDIWCIEWFVGSCCFFLCLVQHTNVRGQRSTSVHKVTSTLYMELLLTPLYRYVHQTMCCDT